MIGDNVFIQFNFSSFFFLFWKVTCQLQLKYFEVQSNTMKQNIRIVETIEELNFFYFRFSRNQIYRKQQEHKRPDRDGQNKISFLFDNWVCLFIGIANSNIKDLYLDFVTKHLLISLCLHLPLLQMVTLLKEIKMK